MRDRITSVIALLLLAIVTGTSYWYSRAMHWQAPGFIPEAAAPDLYARRIALTEFDAAGRAKQTLFADAMSHRSDTDEATFESPRIVSRRPDQPRVEVRARVADVEQSGEQVRMRGDVVLERSAFEGQAALTIRSEEMLALPDEDRYRTDREVTLQRGGSTIRATGMDFDNVARTVVFGADVHASFAPNR